MDAIAARALLDKPGVLRQVLSHSALKAIAHDVWQSIAVPRHIHEIATGFDLHDSDDEGRTDVWTGWIGGVSKGTRRRGSVGVALSADYLGTFPVELVRERVAAMLQAGLDKCIRLFETEGRV